MSFWAVLVKTFHFGIGVGSSFDLGSVGWPCFCVTDL